MSQSPKSSETLSLIVCTRNRVCSLRRCLDAIFATDSSVPFELIVIDNGSNDGTRDYLTSISGQCGHVFVKFGFNLTPGLGRARNTGVSMCSGSIVAFTDDDCYVSPDYVKNILRSFDDQSVGITGGRVLLYDPTDYPISIRTEDSPLRLGPNVFVAGWEIIGASMAFRRNVLTRIGGFPDLLGSGARFGGYEETTAIAKAVWSGVTAFYDPRIVVHHHHGRKTKQEADQVSNYYKTGRGAYYLLLILNPASRWVYAKHWAHDLVNDLRILLGGMRRGEWNWNRTWFLETKSAILFAYLSKGKSLGAER